MTISPEQWSRRGSNTTGTRAIPQPEFTDEQWTLIKRLFVKRPTGDRPPVAPRPCLERIIWILRTDAPWKDLPGQFPSYCTCWRRLNEWVGDGVFAQTWERLLRKLDRRGEMDWEVAVPTRRSHRPKKGLCGRQDQEKAKGPSCSCCSTVSHGLPLGLSIDSAQRSDIRQIEPLLEERILDKQSPRLIYDRVADCDALQDRLAEAGIKLICPHRKNRKRPPKQDGRKLRRYRHRWQVEQTISWLGNCCRLLVRHEHFDHLCCCCYYCCAQLACILFLLKHL